MSFHSLQLKKNVNEEGKLDQFVLVGGGGCLSPNKNMFMDGMY